MDQNSLKNWIDHINELAKKGQINIEINFLFFPNDKEKGERKVNDLLYSVFDFDSDTMQKSMYQRLKKAYSAKKIKKYEIQKFNLIEANDNTYYECLLDDFDNLEKGLNRITIETPTVGFTSDDLSNTVCAAVKFAYDDTMDIAFCGIQNFNQLKKKRLSSGFIGNIDENRISKIDDDHLVFGLGPKVDFVYISRIKEFIINPKGKTTFESTFLMREEYKKRGKEVSEELKNYSDCLIDVDQLSDDLYGADSTSKPLVDKMLAKMSNGDKHDKLEKLLNDKNLFSKRLGKIEEFKKDSRFYKKFSGLEIDCKRGTIKYTKDSIYAFVAILSDRPKESIMLEEKELGS
ncbi:hypothetical protein GNF18_10255 [Ligilactobacillus pobuzihii]|uniref:hypothetical protein n=1 Tax=Ligilactobacillus pobuzihii TaxID=449659 RepID=UPI0019D02CD9|nr:hypothetical protein [Ligilactobacillus pobuzihii]MBN7275522.1 hypothetical protein [Ligilactobacillus pobuzihii]